MTARPGRKAAPTRTGPVVLGVLAACVPLGGLVLLRRRPSLDLTWEHHPSHFWLVLGAGVLSAMVAYGTGVAATRRGDARVLLVSLSFLAAAGFLGLHALATPGVLVAHPNAGFMVATPVGLGIASVFAAWSTAHLEGPPGVRVIVRATTLRVALIGVMVLWAVASLASLPPLDAHTAPERASGRS